MFAIRSEQMEAVTRATLVGFEERALAWLAEDFPHRYRIAGPEPLRALVCSGMKRATDHGLLVERDVWVFVQLAMLLGIGFDEDPQYPWATAALGGVGEEELGELLHRRARAYFVRAHGGDNEHLRRALLRLRDEPARSLDSIPFDADLDRRLTAWLEQVYPEKARVVGEEVCRGLGREAVNLAKRYGFEDAAAAGVIAALMFLLGSGFDQDPQYPWASQALRSKDPDPDATTAQLVKAAKEYLEKWLR